jgi:hypothetical protein
MYIAFAAAVTGLVILAFVFRPTPAPPVRYRTRAPGEPDPERAGARLERTAAPPPRWWAARRGAPAPPPPPREEDT